ncbi:hypothetical protein EYC80_006984 [Monilinia laxa]|uniref:Uncharacterized protein n=1 Tax=Monilinia laxa TaxID=61186 RepID=A0A5N6JZT5_MONLA|nr:hypothetical protein EYC80_006984 [Monilinia laxa]
MLHSALSIYTLNIDQSNNSNHLGIPKILQQKFPQSKPVILYCVNFSHYKKTNAKFSSLRLVPNYAQTKFYDLTLVPPSAPHVLCPLFADSDYGHATVKRSLITHPTHLSCQLLLIHQIEPTQFLFNAQKSQKFPAKSQSPIVLVQ